MQTYKGDPVVYFSTNPVIDHVKKNGENDVSLDDY